jgi:hypothetical protein
MRKIFCIMTAITVLIGFSGCGASASKDMSTPEGAMERYLELSQHQSRFKIGDFFDVLTPESRKKVISLSLSVLPYSEEFQRKATDDVKKEVEILGKRLETYEVLDEKFVLEVEEIVGNPDWSVKVGVESGNIEATKIISGPTKIDENTYRVEVLEGEKKNVIYIVKVEDEWRIDIFRWMTETIESPSPS